ncbi:uncharacterized protein LOC121729071 [Aricia agestis]|uniref:uncharacterized protein LOC121729071 n=1 Tax=Aricia agestis TaxID=91739 RepID=UPI001C206540|nr:uncharacterized protein LOC121729071 [Aricia agestis]
MFLLKNVSQFFSRNFVKNKVFRNPNDLNKCFSTSALLRLKMFAENENKFAYSLMEKYGYVPDLTPGFTNDFSKTKATFETTSLDNCCKETPQRIFHCFEDLAKYCNENNISISDTKFDNFIDTLTDNIKYATNEELKTLFFTLARFPPTESIRTRNFIEVWAALDDECLKRYHTMDFDDVLSHLSLFYLLSVLRYSDFCSKSLIRLASKSKKLNKAQVVQVMFYVGVRRNAPHDMYNLEVFIEENFAQFNIDELAIISMGFFKSKTPIRSMDLIVNIINKVMVEADKVHEVSLAALLKVIRYSMKIRVDNKINDLLDCLQHQLPRLSIMCNVHVALLGTATLTLHENCLFKISETVLHNMTNTRVKDLERLVLTYGTFNYVPKTKECFFTKVIEELNKESRSDEINKHGASFANCVAYLNLLDLRPKSLIQKVLNKEFLMKAYGKHCFLYGREVLTIHNISKIYFKENEIVSPLSDKEVAIMSKKYTDFVPNENYKMQYNATEKMFLDVKRTLREIRGGASFVTGNHIFTHHQRGDIIICNDKHGVPLPVEDIFPKTKFGMIRYPPDDNIWIVLIIAGRNAMIHNSGGPTGHFLTKQRELNKLGYCAAVVSWHIYDECNKNDKTKYLNSLIEESLNFKNPGTLAALYADDTAYFASSLTVDHAAIKIQRTLDLLPDWLSKWRLAVNAAKSQALAGTRNRGFPAPLKIGDAEIPWGRTAKYLGMIIDRSLSMSAQCQAAVNGAKAAVAQLHPAYSSPQIPLNMRIALYKLYVRSRLTYAAPAWHHLLSDSHKRTLQRVQNKVLRRIAGAPWYVRNDTIARDLRVESVEAFVAQLSKSLFARADASRLPELANLAPWHARPPDRHRLPRDAVPEDTAEHPPPNH